MANTVWGTIRKFRFLQLTLCLFMVIMFAPLFSEYKLIGGLAELALLDSLVVAVSASRTGRRMRWYLLVNWLMAISSFGVAVWLEPGAGSQPIFIICTILYTIYCFGCTAAVLAFVAENRQGVTMDSLLASVAAYIMLAISFSCLFSMLILFDSNSFKPPITLNAAHPAQLYLTMIYFSLVTLTTVGYGAIAPHGGFAQMFSGVEALIGQLYLAILVAYLVGRTLSARLTEQAARDHPAGGSGGPGGEGGVGSEPEQVVDAETPPRHHASDQA